ncbi:MAG: DUF1003 domain-containing protein [Verrucomicrobiaceae bacterium]|nr:MAG: DUF1003 domain-containing protein [Verrucomicrobiaceae bacterium]
MPICTITREELAPEDAVSYHTIRPSLAKYIAKKHPEFKADSWISHHALNEFRAEYVEDALEEELGEITEIEREVIDSLKEHDIISEPPDDEDEENARLTFGERISDVIADFGGSWKFIISFGVFIVIWIGMNTLLWKSEGPDPYPFILLNLLLSCIAALQAPVIMMSQHRQESRDREHAEQDYRVNLKSELEIRHLHEKMDHLMQHHILKLMEIQQVHGELLRDLAERLPQKKGE